jgi:hypothetical protein
MEGLTENNPIWICEAKRNRHDRIRSQNLIMILFTAGNVVRGKKAAFTYNLPNFRRCGERPEALCEWKKPHLTS